MNEYQSFRNGGRLAYHSGKHGGELGFTSTEAYGRAAQRLVQNASASNGYRGYTCASNGKVGDVVLYKEATNEFAVITKDGVIKTYMKPEGVPGQYYRDDMLNELKAILD